MNDPYSDIVSIIFKFVSSIDDTSLIVKSTYIEPP